jgi:Ca2+-binding EF-hand superfamily protein
LRFIYRELNYHVRVERLKYELTLRYDWTSRAAFETVDNLRELALNARNIQSFLRLNGFYATESEIVAIVRRLDIDADQKITYSEWADALRPQLSSVDLGASSSSVSASRQEEEKRPSSPLRESGYLSRSQLGDSLARSQASPSRLGESQTEVRASHASPIRPSSPSRLGSSSYAQAKRQSPLKQDDEEELIRAFKEQISLEKELEDAKGRLALQPDFNLMDAFQMLDRTAKGSVTATELHEVLADLGSYALRENVYLFHRRYDRNSDGRLLYSEFCDAFTPKSASQALALTSRSAYYLHQGYPKNEYFTRDTRDQFLRTFKVHFSVEESAELLRKRLLRRPGFSAHDAFTAVDIDRNGYITRDEFKKVLREYGFYALDSELTWLVDRYDRNRDGRISYSEFIDEILPKSPSRR